MEQKNYEGNLTNNGATAQQGASIGDPMGISMGASATPTDAPVWDVTQTRLSLYGAGINTPRGQRPVLQGTLRDVYQWMTSTRMQALTQELRSLTEKEAQQRFKRERLPFATFSGTFSYRNQSGLLQHSGLQCFDFDHLGGAQRIQEVREMLLADPHFDTELMYVSPRGDGLKWVTHIDLKRASHETWYSAICRYLLLRYGLHADPLPSNVASACFLCYDAELIINLKTTDNQRKA